VDSFDDVLIGDLLFEDRGVGHSHTGLPDGVFFRGCSLEGDTPHVKQCSLPFLLRGQLTAAQEGQITIRILLFLLDLNDRCRLGFEIVRGCLE